MVIYRIIRVAVQQKAQRAVNYMWQDFEYEFNQTLLVFGQNIRKARKQKQVSLHTLAETIHYDRGCLTKLEQKGQNIEYQTSIKLAKALNVSYPALFSRNFMESKSNLETDFNEPFCDDDYLFVFIENFQRSMRKRNASQVQVYINTAVSESAVSRVIHGDNKNPTLKTLYAMSFTSHCDMHHLFSRNAEEEAL